MNGTLKSNPGTWTDPDVNLPADTINTETRVNHTMTSNRIPNLTTGENKMRCTVHKAEGTW